LPKLELRRASILRQASTTAGLHHHQLRFLDLDPPLQDPAGERARTAATQDREHGGRRLLDAEAPKNARTGEEEYDTKTPTAYTSASTTPPSTTLLKPTLYTRRDPGFAHPPAAGGAGDGKGNKRIDAGEVV
jgi:hypothetical protein